MRASHALLMTCDVATQVLYCGYEKGDRYFEAEDHLQGPEILKIGRHSSTVLAERVAMSLYKPPAWIPRSSRKRASLNWDEILDGQWHTIAADVDDEWPGGHESLRATSYSEGRRYGVQVNTALTSARSGTKHAVRMRAYTLLEPDDGVPWLFAQGQLRVWCNCGLAALTGGKRHTVECFGVAVQRVARGIGNVAHATNDDAAGVLPWPTLRWLFTQRGNAPAGAELLLNEDMSCHCVGVGVAEGERHEKFCRLRPAERIGLRMLPEQPRDAEVPEWVLAKVMPVSTPVVSAPVASNPEPAPEPVVAVASAPAPEPLDRSGLPPGVAPLEFDPKLLERLARSAAASPDDDARVQHEVVDDDEASEASAS